MAAEVHAHVIARVSARVICWGIRRSIGLFYFILFSSLHISLFMLLLLLHKPPCAFLVTRLCDPLLLSLLVQVMVSTAALDLSGFVRSAARYLRTWALDETPASAAAADGGPPANGADVRPLCLQWMELMLIEKPHLLLLHDEQPKQNPQEVQQNGRLREQLRRLHEHHQLQQTGKEDQQELLREQQQPLVSAVVYTALTVAGTAAGDVAAAQDGGSAAAAAHEEPRRQTSAPTPRDRLPAPTAAAADNILKMALSLLTRYAQINSANLCVITEEFLLLLNDNRRFLVRSQPLPFVFCLHCLLSPASNSADMCMKLKGTPRLVGRH